MRKCILILFAFALFSCESKYPERIGDYYRIDYNGNSNVVLLSEDNTYLINGHITDYIYNDTFLLIEQNPIDSICECNIDCFQKMETFDRKSYDRCKEAFNKTKLRKYWIVKLFKDTISTYVYEKHFDKMKNLIFGPYNPKEYLEKRIEYGISEKLRLNFEKK